jgi:ubiquinone/menaquinone biosynthesis C-methylase UbiE
MTDRERHVVDYYSRHPISSEHVLAKLQESRGHLNDLRPEELYPHDQDHYGGLDANDDLAELARMKAGVKVADFCAGLGGPARYWAHRYDVEVTGIELNPSRIQGAEELTRRVGLEDRVQVISGNVLDVPLADGSVDAVVSQEALLHVPDKLKALEEAFRILKPGGRLAFTDWVMHRPLSAEEAEDMWRGIAAQTLQSIDGYKASLVKAGFQVVSIEDLTDFWGTVLEERLAMYQKLRVETKRAGTPSGDEAFYQSYARLVAHVKARVLGGGRFTAEKPS